MKITCIDKELKEVLESGYYEIPRFQRPYSWDRENVEDFWIDTIAESDGEHFIGSMVVYRAKSDVYGLVDGQQRMTTITMMLAAIRNALKQQGLDELAHGVHGLIERSNIDFEMQFVLQTETSYPYLQEYIQKFGLPEIKPKVGDEEKNIDDAYELIVRKISDTMDSIGKDPTLPEEDKPELIRKRLLEIRNRLLRLKLIFIELDEEDDAYLIFETLNTRGKDLRVSDLVKSHLTKLLKPKNAKVDLPKEKWNSLVELVEQSVVDISMDNFLHHLWLSQYEYTTAKKLFKAVKKQVKRSNAQQFLDSLDQDARTYRLIHETSFGNWKREELDLRNSIDALNLFRVKQDVPMILSIMREYRRGNLKIKHVRKILSAIENFHFAFTAVASQRSSGGISLMYALHARELYNAENLEKRQAVMEELIQKLQEKRPSYQEFEANFLEILFSRKYTKQKRLVQYILEKADRYLRDVRNLGVPVDYSQMTIEHLAPEKPSSDAIVDDVSVAQVGNLILVDQGLNDKLANRSFTEKRLILESCAIPLDDYLASATSWNINDIEQRTRKIAHLAYHKIWRI